MRVHCFQHVPFEGLGSIGPWLEGRGARCATTRFFEGSVRLPDPGDIDFLIILGGPMSVNDESAHTWLRAEKLFIAEAVERGKRVLGICLGAQLIASALGARVYSNGRPEIGWFPIRGTPSEDPAGIAPLLPGGGDVFHWHGETFDMPPGAVNIAVSEACRNQAFTIGDRVVGFQFHLETTPSTARAMIDACRSELVPAPFVQTENEILASPARFERINGIMTSVLDRLGQ